MTRILVTTDAVGGVWRYSVELCSAWSERGVTTILAVLGPPANEAQRAEALAIPGLVLLETGLGLEWTAPDAASLEDIARDLAALADDFDLDSVHLHAPALVGGAAWPAPVVAMVHSCLLTWWRAMRTGPYPEAFACRIAATRAGLSVADQVAAPSSAFAADVRTAYGLGRAIECVHNGRRPMRVPTVDRRAGVFASGRLWDEAKNFAGLDRAARHLSAPVTAAGEKRSPEGGGIDLQHIRHLGVLGETGLAEQLAANSVFAGLSLYEPFGLSVLEAAQAGMALVLSDIPVFRELWRDAALYVDARDTASISQGLEAALADPAPLARKAAERALEFSRDRMADATLSMHTRLRDATIAA